jgi:hypothetical protein
LVVAEEEAAERRERRDPQAGVSGPAADLHPGVLEEAALGLAAHLDVRHLVLAVIVRHGELAVSLVRRMLVCAVLISLGVLVRGCLISSVGPKADPSPTEECSRIVSRAIAAVLESSVHADKAAEQPPSMCADLAIM